ncbi:Uncharacterised protein [Mycobacteroides abscessus subsp. abscessus]|nr:Uncharacterised protein [Mycobacteroides abscessus subsp. abscessus]
MVHVLGTKNMGIFKITQHFAQSERMADTLVSTAGRHTPWVLELLQCFDDSRNGPEVFLKRLFIAGFERINPVSTQWAAQMLFETFLHLSHGDPQKMLNDLFASERPSVFFKNHTVNLNRKNFTINENIVAVKDEKSGLHGSLSVGQER